MIRFVGIHHLNDHTFTSRFLFLFHINLEHQKKKENFQPKRNISSRSSQHAYIHIKISKSRQKMRKTRVYKTIWNVFRWNITDFF